VLDGLRELERGGDGSFLRRVIEAFVSDTRSRLDDLRVGIAANDLPTTARAAHALKGSCRNIGARRMASLCEQLEQAANGTDPAAAHQALSRLEDDFAAVKLILAEELNLAS